MKIKIQFASLKNLKDIQDLNHQLCIKEYNEFDSTINKDYPIQADGKKYFKDRIKNSCALVAIVDSNVAGYLVGAIAETESYRNNSRIAEVENMFVLENYRNFGIGKQLFREFVKWCKTKGAKRIRAVASAQNTKAIKFYRRKGFADYNLTLEKKI